ncbi:nicotinate (nicotinamide) nucleotide adenylyltransferase [archaeon]|nr:nicotinate (nicotinamide) nucleotide adenylyltransferase [archaeon]
MKKKIALFGGSFNPIHKKHLDVIKEVIDSKKIDEIWILPCKNHSFNKKLISEKDRINMIKFAVEGFKVNICREELDFEGRSYAYETVIRLKKKFPSFEFYWIIGSDIFYEFDKWYKHEALAKEIKFIVSLREGFPIKRTGEIRIFFTLEEKVNNISSTTVRECIKKGENIQDFVPLKVKKYIMKNGLYKN